MAAVRATIFSSFAINSHNVSPKTFVYVAAVVADSIEIASERAHRRSDRHFIVVQHDDQTRLQMAGLVYRFHRHAAGQRCIADQRDDVMIFIFPIASDRHSQGGGQRSRSVTGSERVVLRFIATEETAEPSVLLNR